MQQPPWMAFAWNELDQREIAGPAANARIAQYFRLAGHPEITTDETPWCAAFVGACLAKVDIDGTYSLLARSYLDWGVDAQTPHFGAIAVLSRAGDPSLGHVGFLIGVTERYVILLGGIQSDAVTVAAFDRGCVLGTSTSLAGNCSAGATDCDD